MSEQIPKQTKSETIPDIFNPERQDWRRDELPFTVLMSVATFGAPRDDEGWEGRRSVAAGDMSRNYAQPDQLELDQARRSKELTDEQRADMARMSQEKCADFVRSVGYDPANAAIMSPQTSYARELGIINIDDPAMLTEDPDSKLATRQPKQGDLIYTRDREKVLGCRPADCPVVTIKGTDEDGQDILAMLHVGWQGLNAGYLEQAIGFLSSEHVDLSTLRIYVGAGAKKENFPYTNEHDPRSNGNPRFTHEDRDKLFVDVRKNSESGKFEFNIDMFGFINYMLTDPKRIGLRPEQIAFDGSDTADLSSGYSSHSRPASGRTSEVETRDLIIASMGEPDFHEGL